MVKMEKGKHGKMIGCFFGSSGGLFNIISTVSTLEMSQQSHNIRFAHIISTVRRLNK
jgi:hypothetical protein